MGSYYEQKSWLKTYPEWLPGEIYPPGQSLLDEFLKTAKSRPASPCIHYFDHTLNYNDIKNMAVALAAALFDMGIAAGDRVVVCRTFPRPSLPVLPSGCEMRWWFRSIQCTRPMN
jgi:long-chain acyl-CoA synthetase